MRDEDLALLDAVLAGDSASVERALADGADPNVRDTRYLVGNGNSPLHNAACVDSAEVVGILLAAGATVDARCDDGWTPLMRACNSGNAAVAEALLDAGADPHLRNNEGYTAWGRIPGGCSELIALMRSRGASNSRSPK